MSISEFHDEVLENAGDFLSNNRTPSNLDNLIIFALLHYLVKSYRLFKGINLLCKNNLEQEAKILLRSLFEAYLLEEYIADEPNDISRAEDCAIRAHVADKKQIEEMDSLGMHEESDIITREIKDKQDSVIKIKSLNYEEAITRVRKRHPGWNRLTDKQVANQSQLEVKKLVEILNKKYENRENGSKNLIKRHYSAITRDCSKSTHCNDLDYNVYKNSNGEWEIFPKSKATMNDAILLESLSMFISIMQIVNELLKFDKNKLIKELDDKYQRYIQAKKDE